MIDWNNPEERAELAARIGVEAYNKAAAEHRATTVIEVIFGQELRHVSSRFGRLVAVGETGQAFSTIEQARAYAQSLAYHPPAEGETTDALSDELAAFCDAQSLPFMSADELLHEELTEAQRSWVSQFVMRWEKVQAQEDFESACRIREEG